jgi:glycosyltransferase involved in cell wall biosynthesis
MTKKTMNTASTTDPKPLYLETVDFPLGTAQNAPPPPAGQPLRAALSMNVADSSHPDLLPPGISVVVPVYNSQATLADLLARLAPVLAAAAPRHEVILVNDGSRDGSWAVIQQLRQQYPFVVGFDMMRNYGQHNALLCGIRAARFDRIVTLDDDLQNPPEEVPRMLAKLDEGFDVVYGKPQAMTHGLWRNLASKITKQVLQKAMGADTAANISAFRVFRTAVRDAFGTYRSPFVSIDVLLTWGTTRFTAIEVKHDARTVGQSNYTLKKLLVHALNMVTGFSTWPLQLASMIGFVFTLIGFGLLLFVIIRRFTSGQAPPGFYFLASVIAIFSGAQLFALGIMGEYLARLHFRTMERPTYTVRSRLETSIPSPPGTPGGEG